MNDYLCVCVLVHVCVCVSLRGTKKKTARRCVCLCVRCGFPKSQWKKNLLQVFFFLCLGCFYFFSSQKKKGSLCALLSCNLMKTTENMRFDFLFFLIICNLCKKAARMFLVLVICSKWPKNAKTYFSEKIVGT